MSRFERPKPESRGKSSRINCCVRLDSGRLRVRILGLPPCLRGSDPAVNFSDCAKYLNASLKCHHRQCLELAQIRMEVINIPAFGHFSSSQLDIFLAPGHLRHDTRPLPT